MVRKGGFGGEKNQVSFRTVLVSAVTTLGYLQLHVITQPHETNRGIRRWRSTDGHGLAEPSRRGAPKRALSCNYGGPNGQATPTLSPIIRVRLRLGFRASRPRTSKGTEPRAGPRDSASTG